MTKSTTQLVHMRAGDGPPLVLLHGFASRWQVWRPVIPGLVDEREVIAIDLPGFGRNPRWPSDRPFSVSTLGAEVVAFLNDIGIQRPHVAGNSLGGAVALEMARTGAAASVTALSPAGFVSGPNQMALGALVVGAQVLVRVVPRWISIPSIAIRPAVNPLLRIAVAHPRRMTTRDLQALAIGVRRAPDVVAQFRHLEYRAPSSEELTVPVTIAWGARDRALWPALDLVRRSLPNARAVALDGCGHVPMTDDPALVTRVLLDGSSECASRLSRADDQGFSTNQLAD